MYKGAGHMGYFDQILNDLQTTENELMQIREHNKRLQIELKYNEDLAKSRIAAIELQREALLNTNKLLTFERDEALKNLQEANERIKKLEFGYMSKNQRDEIENLKREVLYFMQLAFNRK